MFILPVFTLTLIVGCLSSTPQNVAQSKNAIQSSGSNSTARKAVDGDISSDYPKLARTNNDTGSNWWRVDLGQSYKIGKVVIFGRTDSGTARDMSKVYILTTNQNPFSSPPSPNNTDWEIVYYIEPVLAEREEITLYLTSQYRYLSLYREVGNIVTREVEVYNWSGDNPQTLTQTAMQSSTWYGGGAADKAINGLVVMRGIYGSYTSTNRNSTPHWWRVSLKESCTNCYVRLYPYLRRKHFGTAEFSRLHTITVLSSSARSLSSPSLTPSSQWKTCYHIPTRTYQNGPTIDSCNQENITYVAVYKNTEQALELVEVEVFHSVEDVFSSVILTAVSSSSVKMTWSVKSNHFISYFKFSCTGKTSLNISSTVKEQIQCGYSAYDEAECEIEAIGFGNKIGKNRTNTLCAAPSKPAVTSVDQTNQWSGDLPNNRLKFTVSWTASIPNCARVDYSVQLVGPDGQTKRVNAGSSRSAVFEKRIAGVNYTVTVTAINNVNNQTESDLHRFTAKPRAPEFGDRTATLTAKSPYSVKLQWDSPQYENGAVTKYQYKCGSENRSGEISGLIKDDICGFNPYEEAICEVRAKNDANEWSLPIESNAVRTPCAAPTKPTAIEVNQTNQNSVTLPKNRLKFTVRWTASTPNCARVEYSVQLMGTDGETKNVSSRGARTVDFERKRAGTRYTVNVTAINKPDSITSPSDTFNFTAKSRAPEFGDSKARLTATSSKCVKLQWESPQYGNGADTKYKFKCTNRTWTEFSRLTRGNICGYLPNQQIRCEVQARNNARIGKLSIRSNTAQTYCATPTVEDFILSEKKTIVQGKERRQITVNISSGGKSNCDNASLTIRLYKPDGTVAHIKYISNLSGTVMFDNLDAVTIYKISVFAINNAGYQTTPRKMTRETGEVAPYTHPKYASPPTTNASCVTLTWGEPSEPNGVITNYTYICSVWNGTRQNTLTVPAKSSTICDLRSASPVICNITARNSEGNSPPLRLGTVYTSVEYKEGGKPAEPKKSGNAVDGQINIMVDLPKFENENTNISFYRFILEEVDSSLTSRRKRSSGIAVHQDLLFNYTKAESLNLTYYVAGEISPPTDANTITFEYGTGEILNGYENKKLKAGEKYKTHYLFAVQLGKDENPYLVTGTQTFEVYVTPLTTEPPQDTVAIVVPTVVVLLVIIVIIAVLIIKKRRSGQSDEVSKTMMRLEDSDSTHGDIPPTTESDLNPVSKRPTSVPSQKAPQKPSISVKPMASSKNRKPEITEPGLHSEDYVNVVLLPKDSVTADRPSLQAYINHNREQISLQYKEIGSLPKIEMSRASEPDTKGKNRYKGLYPGDSHRVKLVNSPHDSDYINASYLDGYDRPNKFIAAMGPLPNTVNDFWLMLWEQKVRTVVMVTKLIEEGKDKCAQYWPPLRETTEYDKITVKLVAEDPWADYIVRNLHVTKGEEIRHVVQYHYQSWPDHGVPRYTGPFVSFYRKINKDVNDKIATNPGPCVVHCSAGVGRTGTFIALDYLLDQGKTEKELRVFDCIKAMRERRPAMVQKEEQYFFLHSALLEAITSANFSTNTTAMKDKLAMFEEDKRGKILEEFKIIVEESGKIKHDFSSGEDPDNQCYNLTQNMLPDDLCRPFLLDSNTDYVNAVMINGTHVELQYICTQSPLPNTLNHFWGMMFDQGFGTIIITQRNQFNILPAGEFKAGKYTVTKKKVWMDEFPTTELLINYKDKPSLRVTMFDMSEIWSDDLQYIECQKVISLYETVKRWLQQSKNPKVTVVCRDGASRCGLIINSFNCLEKLELEQQCDVYSSVLMSKTRRPQLIPTVNDYMYIYQMLREYADGYNAYANFD